MTDDTRQLPGFPRQRSGPAWARPDPIDELARELEEPVAAAVHPDEIAALLESDGLSDDRIRERYGVENSFALAEQLYARTPRRHPEPDGPPPDPWRTGLLGCLLRGLVFALPGFAHVLGAPLLAGPHDAGLPAGTRALLAGALCGWAWNQGLAHRAYTWLGLGDRPAALRCLLVGTPAGMVLGTLTAFAVAGPGHPAAVTFAAGQSVYLGASGTLLVLGRERALLVALLPLTAAAPASLTHSLPTPAALTLLTLSLTTVTTLAFLEVSPALDTLKRRAPAPGTPTARGPGPSEEAPAFIAPKGCRGLRDRPRRSRGRATATVPRPRTHGARKAHGVHAGAQGPRLVASLPYAVFGLATGTLVLHAALADTLAEAQRSAPAAVALTLSMGPAEWLLYRFRSAGLATLRSSRTPRAFRRVTVRSLAGCLAGYLAALLVLALATTALWPGAPAPAGLRLAGLLTLGVVLWTGLLLQSAGAVLGATAVCCAAALAQTLALLTRAGPPHAVALAVSAAAALAQSALVCGLLGRVTAHR
ncbi:hypothetical protein JK359_35345 [Streptomyces actinomycinicus]|uniref:Uncharacterized protein n=1 Tax=Streptomyces actinomycinicus TaxID=1695166 RepID=A0A937ES98_9ACTN|nr:hypothetical protein [Streptomyces actinomycinicus]MBL1087185.1 hypothetical protein [Streptomyces actinomycinicus]